MKTYIVALALALAGCATTTQQTAAPAAGVDKVTIKIGSPFKPGHILVDAAEKFKELAEQRSSGRIAVQIDAGTKSEEEVSNQNASGALAPVPVRAGAVVGDRTVIEDGLAIGDNVVVEGAYALKAQMLKAQLGEGHAH